MLLFVGCRAAGIQCCVMCACLSLAVSVLNGEGSGLGPASGSGAAPTPTRLGRLGPTRLKFEAKANLPWLAMPRAWPSPSPSLLPANPKPGNLAVGGP